MKKSYKIAMTCVGILMILIIGLIFVSFYFHNQGVDQANEEYREYQPRECNLNSV